MRSANMKLVVLALLVGCTLPHVDPEPRPPIAQVMTVVRVDSDCSEPSPLKTGDPDDPHQFDPDIVWRQPSWGTGVVISERHIITAEHVVRCPIIPTVRVTFPDGRWFWAAVEKDAWMFGDGTDLARLVLASDSGFHVYVPPPTLSQVHEGEITIQTLHGRTSGALDDDVYVDTPTRPGDSGAPAYDSAGLLVGVVDAGPSPTRIVRVTPWWLKGT